MEPIKFSKLVIITALALGFLVGCSSQTPTAEVPATLPPTTPSEQTTPVPLSISFPLSEPGPYFAGNKSYTLIDESRNGREIQITI
jgi:hypothetical protein